jgi:cysteinyl-tRNA synthetase
MIIYNTMKREKQKLKPIVKGTVGIYACGPTLYFYPHIGNWRAYIVQDLLKRTLIADGYAVKHIMNMTDVGHLVSDEDAGEDKMRVAVKREHKTIKEISDFYASIFLDGLKRLNVLMPDKMPKPSEHIPDILALMEELDKKGYLYTAKDGVYFNTRKFKKYGALMGMDFKSLSESLKAGARVERPEGLKNITDFAVWRFADRSEKEMVWDTRFGFGFPGWHIECSAMSTKYLGQPFDIHCGGVDHIRIHHTNEIAQSTAATGMRLANYWFHNFFLLVENQKMSKSLGNVYLLDDINSKGFSEMGFRYLVIGAHYRKDMNFTWEALQGAENAVRKIYSLATKLSRASKPASRGTAGLKTKVSKAEKGFYEAMNDDIDSPSALAKFHEIVNEANQMLEAGSMKAADPSTFLDAILRMDRVLGLQIEEQIRGNVSLPKEAEALIAERERFRKERNFAESDRVRKVLKEKFGIVVEDTKDGVSWHRE